jgi:hypothetical protein
MLVQFQDKDYEFEIEDIELSQARYIKRHTTLSVRALLNGLRELDPDCLAAIYWLMLQQNGTVVDIAKVNFPVLRFAAALGDAMSREKEETPTTPPEKAVTARTRK